MADNLPSGTEFRAGRADSTASASSTGSTTSATTGWAGEQQQPKQTAVPGRPDPKSHEPFRRPSHPLFEGLTAQKRKDDPVSLARRQSMNEQRSTPGFLGQMWNKYVFDRIVFLLISRCLLSLVPPVLGMWLIRSIAGYAANKSQTKKMFCLLPRRADAEPHSFGILE